MCSKPRTPLFLLLIHNAGRRVEIAQQRRAILVEKMTRNKVNIHRGIGGIRDELIPPRGSF